MGADGARVWVSRRARRTGKVLTAGLGGVKLFRRARVGQRQAVVNAAYVCEIGVERASDGDERPILLRARGPVHTRAHTNASVSDAWIGTSTSGPSGLTFRIATHATNDTVTVAAFERSLHPRDAENKDDGRIMRLADCA